MNEFKRHKRSDKIKWIVTAIAFLLVLVMLTGLFMQLFMPDGKKPADWFKKNDKEQTTPIDPDKPEDPDTPIKPEDPEDPIDNGGSVIGDADDHGIALLSAMLPRAAFEANGIDPQADSAYTLTATVTPEYADDKAVDWAIAWKDPSSRWASGKTVTDYVYITPSSDGALTATVTCNKAFGEQAIITVSSRHNADIKATTTVDYRERITGVNYVVTADGMDYVLGSDTVLPYTDDSSGRVDVQKSDGTIATTFEATATVHLDGAFVTQLLDSGCDYYNMLSELSYGTIGSAMGAFGLVERFQTPFETCFNKYEGYENYINENVASVMSWIKNEYNGVILVFDVTVTENGNNHTYSYGVDFDRRGMTVYIGSLSLGNGIIF